MAKVKISVDTKGFESLNRQLSQLSDSMFRKYARAGVMAVARKKRELQRAMVPSNEGMPAKNAKGGRKKLRQSIAIKPSAKWRNAAKHAANGVVGASVGPRWPDGAHASLLEFGFNQKWMLIEDADILVKRATPKQIPPQPFIRPAFDAMRAHQNTIFAHEIRKRMDRDLAKNKGKR